MEAITISASPRSGTGKGANRKLRASGQIPAVLYGHNVEDAISLSIDPRALNKALDNPKGQNALLEIDIEGGGTRTLALSFTGLSVGGGLRMRCWIRARKKRQPRV